MFCSGPQSRGLTPGEYKPVLNRQNFIRAPSKQIHIFAPGILSTQSLLPPGSLFLVIFSPRLGWSRGKEMSPGAHLVVKSLALEADRSGFQLQLLL